MRPLSVVVLTFNEAENIERCLRSVRGLADECLVVDSYSTDETVALAKSLGARTLERPFHSYSDQRAFAAQEATHDLVLALDADEYLSSELQKSVQLAKTEEQAGAYTFNRRNRIGETWLRYTSWYPDRKLRLFDRRCVQFTGIGGHDTIIPETGTKIKHLSGDLLHHTSADIDARMAQVNKLSTASARYQFDHGKKGQLWRLLLKPPIRFFTEFILKRGFLDGFYGYVISRTAAQYVFLREAKLLEMGRRKQE